MRKRVKEKKGTKKMENRKMIYVIQCFVREYCLTLENCLCVCVKKKNVLSKNMDDANIVLFRGMVNFRFSKERKERTKRRKKKGRKKKRRKERKKKEKNEK